MPAHHTNADRRRNIRILREVNAVSVTADELRTFIDECQRSGGIDSFENLMLTAVRTSGDPIRACAMTFRARALIRLVEPGPRGWTIPSPDGSVFAAHTLFAAGVMEPLVAVGTEFAFNRSRFLDRLLELSPRSVQIR